MQENRQVKSTIKQNILLFLDSIGVSQYDFYRKTGVTRGVLGQKNGISEDNLARFLAYYPEVNTDWLLTGHGPMLREEQLSTQSTTTPTITDRSETDAYYKMYEKKDAEASALKEEVGMLKERIKQLETNISVGQIEQQRSVKETML